MLVCKFLCNVHAKRALIGLCLVVMSHLGQIRDPWHSQVFTIAQIVIGLSLHTHSFIHPRYHQKSQAVFRATGMNGLKLHSCLASTLFQIAHLLFVQRWGGGGEQLRKCSLLFSKEDF